MLFHNWLLPVAPRSATTAPANVPLLAETRAGISPALRV